MTSLVRQLVWALTFFFFAGCDQQVRQPRCAGIKEGEGQVIARGAIAKFFDQVKRGDFGGRIQDGGREISPSEISDISEDDIVYDGIAPGETEDGQIFQFKIRQNVRLWIGVYVFDSCGTEVRWKIREEALK